MSQIDQTARFHKEYIDLIRGKRVLVIGSGSDLDNRNVNEIAQGYDVIIKVNKNYGNSNVQPDIIFTRWASWIDDDKLFPKYMLDNAKVIVIVNQHVGISATEIEWICEQIGHNHASCGLIAVHWALCKGASEVGVIGFGYSNGAFNRDKVYTTANNDHIPGNNTEGTKDVNPLYDWHKERMFLCRTSNVKLID